jgi:glutaredoxin
MITIYTTPTCVFCKAVKEYLTDKKKEFKVVDLTEDQDAAKWVLDNTGQLAVPVTRFDDNTIVVGFDRPRLEAALAK